MSSISLNRTTIITVVLLIEVAIVLFFVARWYSRRWGWRSTFRRVRGYVRLTFADLVRPAIQVYRFGRSERLIAAQLSSPELGGVLRSTTAHAQARLSADPDSWPYATLIGPDRVALALAGPDQAEPTAPWRAVDGRWVADRSAVTPGPTVPIPDVPIGHVVIGAENGTVTLLDLLRAPGAIEVTGPDRPVGSLICAVAAQLSSGLTAFGELDVIVASGLHPRFDGPKPLDVLRDLDARSRAENYQHRITVLLCGPLNRAECDLLTAIIRRLPLLRVMMAGPYAGRRWKLPLSETGRIEAPELGLSTDSAPVERGVARALKDLGTGVVPPPHRPPVAPAAPAPSSRRTDIQPEKAGYGWPADPAQSAFFAEPPVEEAPTQPQFASSRHRSYPDDAYAPPPTQASAQAEPSSPQAAPSPQAPAPAAPSPWDLDEPEPDSPQTAGLSLSAINGRPGREAGDSDTPEFLRDQARDPR